MFAYRRIVSNVAGINKEKIKFEIANKKQFFYKNITKHDKMIAELFIIRNKQKLRLLLHKKQMQTA